ncbi:hypothetical protein A3H77_00590 [Candidatus Kaiserbacteria bacterium RIFCSPLOWO2_02_FULL_56_11]|nr:MAG: hypothetical protein A3H77_00590 [Candidatus Kaiserbacteria bacterium RIFCSPLOWO2_02_FULL_56_11]
MERDEIPVERRNDVPCRHGCTVRGAVARVETLAGCACFPEDRVQDLCGQHFLKIESAGPIITVLIYQPELYDLLTTK